MRFKYIDHRDGFLQKVIELGDRNSSTLGHFTREAFKAVAKKKWILICHEGESLLGYIMFRVVQKSNSLSITHLCVNDDCRGKGVANELIRNLRNKYEPQLRGFGLNCRDDYFNAKRVWKRLGFKPIKTKRGRGKRDSNLSLWWLDFNAPTLFSEDIESGKQKALIDANIVIDLRDETEGKPFVKALLSDWLIDDVDYYFANEMYLEIDADPNTERREKTRAFIKRNFKRTKFKPSEYDSVLTFLNSIKDCKNENDKADLRQIGEAVSSGCSYFLTQDREIQKLKDQLFDKYGIYIMSPDEFLIEIDSLINSSNYQPARLAGTSYEFGLVHSKELNMAVDEFLKNSEAEKKTDFKSSVSKLVSNGNAHLKVVKHERTFFGLIGLIEKEKELIVEVLRVGNHYLSDTLMQQLLTYTIRRAVSSKKGTILILEKYLNDNQISIIRSFQFQKVNNTWRRDLVCGIYNDLSLIQQIEQENIIVENGLILKDMTFHPKIERVLFPVKLSSNEVDCFIVPIKPYWAAQLFDHFSAGASLFSARPELSWNKENVYYRSANPRIITGVGRILWYISNDDRAQRKKCIVGSSFIENVDIDEAKTLFMRYKRLGIYEWRDIERLTNKDHRKEIMAIKFADTELFPNAINLSEVQGLINSATGKHYTFQSPVRISNDIFIELYRMGFNQEIMVHE
ncbi:MAG: GNAT family N-acetyltransferase [Cytophagales bacterium]|nr:GNAT family N-acetyltransferase [Cytophagales bacterium]